MTTTYTYNGLNQLLSKTGPDGTVNYTYDARGNQILEENLTSGTSTAMEYAVTGEMTSLTEYSGETATMTQRNVYDHNGIRIRKTEDGTSRDYYYDNGVVAFTMDGNDISTANILTPQGAVAGSYRGSIYHTYLKDQQGSTTSIINEDGTLSAAYDYSDFGETTEITGSGFDNQVCYTGGIYDEETGLYYLNARYYDPELGRFLSQDTYRGMPEESDQWHLYAYCANNPINYVDPSGHKVITESSTIKRKQSSVTITIKNLKWKRNTKTKKIRVNDSPRIKSTCDFPGLVVLYMAYITQYDKYLKNITMFISVLHFKEKITPRSSLAEWLEAKPRNVVTLRVLMKGSATKKNKVCSVSMYTCKPQKYNWKNYK